MKTKPPPGSKVRFTSAFLRNTGQYTGGAGRSVWQVIPCDCGLCKRGKFIATNERNYDGDGQLHIAIGNVELVKPPAQLDREIAQVLDKADK